MRTSAPVFASHTFAVPSALPVTIRDPRGQNDAELTLPLCRESVSALRVLCPIALSFGFRSRRFGDPPHPRGRASEPSKQYRQQPERICSGQSRSSPGPLGRSFERRYPSRRDRLAGQPAFQVVGQGVRAPIKSSIRSRLAKKSASSGQRSGLRSNHSRVGILAVVDGDEELADDFVQSLSPGIAGMRLFGHGVGPFVRIRPATRGRVLCYVMLSLPMS